MDKTNKQGDFILEKDRRSTGALFHRYRRQTDPSIWLPGVITLVVGAFILWSVSALNDVEGLKSAKKQNAKWHEESAKWHEEHELRMRMLEMAVSRLLPNKDMQGMYMTTSGNK